jgi:hypothetical protein
MARLVVGILAHRLRDAGHVLCFVREAKTYRMRSRFSLSRQHTSKERGPRDTLC